MLPGVAAVAAGNDPGLVGGVMAIFSSEIQVSGTLIECANHDEAMEAQFKDGKTYAHPRTPGVHSAEGFIVTTVRDGSERPWIGIRSTYGEEPWGVYFNPRDLILAVLIAYESCCGEGDWEE